MELYETCDTDGFKWSIRSNAVGDENEDWCGIQEQIIAYILGFDVI